MKKINEIWLILNAYLKLRQHARYDQCTVDFNVYDSRLKVKCTVSNVVHRLISSEMKKKTRKWKKVKKKRE